MEIENGAFATKEVFWVSRVMLYTESDEVVEIKGVEPRLMSSRVLLCCPTYLAKLDRASASQSAVAPHDGHRVVGVKTSNQLSMIIPLSHDRRYRLAPSTLLNVFKCQGLSSHSPLAILDFQNADPGQFPQRLAPNLY
jgi:hypothetical protein